MRQAPSFICLVALAALLAGCACSDDAPICKGHEDCEPSGQLCGPDGECVECLENEDCPEGFICIYNHTCSEEPVEGCRGPEDCEDPTPFCTLNGQCVECLENENCPEGYTCVDYICLEDSMEGCQGPDDCEAPTPFCSLAGDCVECLQDEHCDTEADERCIDHQCSVQEIYCDFEGFTPTLEITRHGYTSDGNRALIYTGVIPRQYDFEVIAIELWGSGQPAPSFEPGITELGQHPNDQNYQTCSTCVLIAMDCDSGGCRKFYLAVEGQLVIDELGDSTGDRFEGRLQNVVLEEVFIHPGSYESIPVSDGNTWCIDEMPFSSYLNLECIDDDECPSNLSICRDDGRCVECVEDTHCREEHVCDRDFCLDVSTCHIENFSPVEEYGLAGVFFYYEAYYIATDADENTLRLNMSRYDPSDLEPGRYPLESYYTWVSIRNCDGQDCEYFSSVGGELVVHEVSLEDGEFFSGTLENAFFQEMYRESSGMLRPMPHGRIWCISELEFAVRVNLCDHEYWCFNERPFCRKICIACLSSDDCEDEAFPYCNVHGSCVECIAEDDCENVDLGFCSDDGLCVACLTDDYCEEGGLPYCQAYDEENICVECTEDAHCANGKSCLLGLCLIPTAFPEGNTCSEAIELLESGVHAGTMESYTNNFAPGYVTLAGSFTCTDRTAEGPDIVYEVALEPGQRLEVVYTVQYGDASIYITSDCLDHDPPTNHYEICLVGADNSGRNEPEQIAYTNSTGSEQTVYVVLDVRFCSDNRERVAWFADFKLLD